MKNKFLNFAMRTIKANNTFDEVKLAELKYGLEAFYMLSTKLIVIIFLSLIFGLFKELLIFILIYSPLRGVSFGFHANSSIECWLISVPIFIIIPFLAECISIPLYVIHIMILLATVSFLFFAPADTKKRPLINAKKRRINKTVTVLISLLYLFLTLFIKNHIILNTLMFACIWQAICVNPLIYKLFKQPYNNYKCYLKEV